MAIQRVIQELDEVIDTLNFPRLCTLLLRNEKSFQAPENVEFRNFLVSKAARSRNNDIIATLAGFITRNGKFGENDHLDENLKLTIDNGNTEVCRVLLKKGAKVANLQWENGVLQILNRDHLDSRSEMFSLLTYYDLNVTGIRDDAGRNFLLQFIYHFVKKDDADALMVAQTIIDNGVSKDECDNSGFSPLDYSILTEHTELVSFFIDRGANVSMDLGMDKMVTILAAVKRKTELLSLILERRAQIKARGYKPPVRI